MIRSEASSQSAALPDSASGELDTPKTLESGESESSPAEQHLLPQLTLRSVLLWFTISIIGAWVVRQATLESQWAVAMVVAFAATAAFFLIYASLFLVVWLPTELIELSESKPIAKENESEDEFPPQLIPPRERNVAR